MLDGRLDRALPHEAEVAVPRAHGLARDEVAGVRPGTVDVQALVAERVGNAVLPELDDLCAEDVAVEGVRPLAVRDRDDDVVESQAGGQGSRSQ
jgi:ATP phosphoribosyltransferase